MEKEKRLFEFQTIADSITKKYSDAYDESDLEPEEYIKSIRLNLQNELGRSSTKTLEQSLAKDREDVLAETLKIIEISINKLKQEIAIKFKNKKHE